MTWSHCDPSRYRWRKVEGEPGLSYKVRHEYTILGYDLAAGTLDMLVRWEGDGGHCPIHRHVATTTVLVLEGEQHLWDLHPDGTRGEHRVRRAGDYALTVGDALPHLERGGEQGEEDEQHLHGVERPWGAQVFCSESATRPSIVTSASSLPSSPRIS